MTAQKKVQGNDLNLDPISGATGAHPVGTGLGAAAGGAAAPAHGGASVREAWRLKLEPDCYTRGLYPA